jgi:alpha-ribazole phosphatase
LAVRIWLIRHGLMSLGERGCYQGRLDGGLSEIGRAALGTSDCSPDHVYVSPSRRARETAEILFPSAEFIAVPDLREMNFGVFEGRGWWEMESDPAYRAWVDGGCAGRCPGGEGRADFSARVCAAMRELLQRERETLVIVAHGGTQMAALERWGRPERDYYRWQTACGCGYLLSYERQRDEMRVERELSFLI